METVEKTYHDVSYQHNGNSGVKLERLREGNEAQYGTWVVYHWICDPDTYKYSYSCERMFDDYEIAGSQFTALMEGLI